MGVEIAQLLDRDYDIQVKANEIRLQTLSTLRNLGEDRAHETHAEDADKGDLTNEFNGKTIDMMRAVEIPTYSDKTLVKLNDVDDGQQQPIFMVHDLYGTVEPLRHIGKLLSCPAYGLQYTKDAPTQSIEELASFYIRHMKEVVSRGIYRIVGYSFGAIVALEMSLMLKKSGQEVNLIMLDGSQKYVSSFLVSYRERYNFTTDSEAAVGVLVMLAEKVAKVDKMNLINTLMGLSTIQSQINETSNAIMKANRNLDNKESVLSYITYFMNLLRMVEQYSSSSKYSGNIMVIRAKIVDEMSNHLGDDLGVKEICDGSVTISWVEGDHLSVLHGHGAAEIANIITASQ